jgi:hypothetical protein
MLEDKEPEQETETPEPEAEAPEAEAEEEPEAEAAEPEPKEEQKPKAPREPKSVPLAAFLEVQRKLEAKLQEAEKRAADLESKTRTQPDYSSFFRKPPEKTPSVYDDEQGYNDANRQFVQADTYNTRFGMSLDYAVQSFGQERVNEAMHAFQQAAQSNPLLMQAAEKSYNPVREIVQWHELQTNIGYIDKVGGGQTLKKIADAGGFDAYEKALRAQIEKEMADKAAAQVADDDDEDEAPIQKKPILPGNFNKGGKGGNKDVPRPSDLKTLLA